MGREDSVHPGFAFGPHPPPPPCYSAERLEEQDSFCLLVLHPRPAGTFAEGLQLSWPRDLASDGIEPRSLGSLAEAKRSWAPAAATSPGAWLGGWPFPAGAQAEVFPSVGWTMGCRAALTCLLCVT